MRRIIPSASGCSVAGVMAAVMLGTGLGAQEASAGTTTTTGTQQIDSGAVRDITRYCQVCWRNARLPEDQWGDCTQQVFARLLETVGRDRWAALLPSENEDKREFLRAIDAVKKRTQRARRFSDLSADVPDNWTRYTGEAKERRDEVNRVAGEVLSDRQQKIINLSADGWGVPEIAVELGTTAQRISDEKYKAIRKLREKLGVDSAE
jgi:RNA polymerase sigma factor (sigma-70 family)